MKKKSLIKIFFIFFICAFNLSLFYSDTVKATTYTTDFEDGVPGNSYTWTGYMSATSKRSGAEFQIMATTPYSGLLDFHCHASTGHWNLTRTDYLTGVSFMTVIGISDFFVCYNQTQYLRGDIDLSDVVADGDYIIGFYYDGANIKYYNYVNVATNFGSLATGHNKMSFSINGVSSVTYSYNNISVVGTPRNVTALNSGYKIDRIYIDSTQAFEIDDLSLTYSSSNYSHGTGGGTSCGETPDGLLCRGTILSNYYVDGNVRHYLLQQNLIPMNSTVYYLDVDVGTQYNKDSVLTNYIAYLGIGDNFLNAQYTSVGNPSCVFERNGDTVFRWYYSTGFKTIKDKQFIIALYHAIDNAGGFSWEIGTGQQGQDLDGDNHRGLFSSVNLNDNNVLVVGGGEGVDLSYNLWYYQQPSDDQPSYSSDTLSIYGNQEQTLPNGTKLFHLHGCEDGTVRITYFISQATMSAGAYLKIYYDSAGNLEVGQQQGFGTTLLNKYSFTMGFVPSAVGNYHVAINTSTMNTVNASFYVDVAQDSTLQVYSSPNPSYGVSSFNINYTYTHPRGWSGALGLAKTPNILTREDCVMFWDNISSGSSGSRQYTPYDITTYYAILFVAINDSIYNYAPYSCAHTHLVYLDMYYLSQISANPSVVLLSEDVSTQTPVNICWKHSNVGAGIVLKINDIIAFDKNSGIGNFNTGCINYYPTSAGSKEVKMMIDDIVLACCYFNVSLSPEEVIVTPLLPPFPPEMGALVGVVVIACFTLLPLLIAVMINRNSSTDISVHPLVYAFFMVIGLILTVQLGLFEMWVLFFIIFIIILIIAVLWLSKSKDG